MLHDTLSYPHDTMDFGVGVVEPPIREPDARTFDTEPTDDTVIDQDPASPRSEGAAESGHDLLKSNFGGSDEYYNPEYEGFTYEWVTEKGIINSEDKDAIESLALLADTTPKMLEDQQKIADHFASSSEPLFYDDTKETDEGTLTLLTVYYLDSERGIHTAHGTFLVPKEKEEEREVVEEPQGIAELSSEDIDENDSELFGEDDESDQAEAAFEFASLFAKREQAYSEQVYAKESVTIPNTSPEVTEIKRDQIDFSDQAVTETVSVEPNIYQVLQKAFLQPVVQAASMEVFSQVESAVPPESPEPEVMRVEQAVAFDTTSEMVRESIVAAQERNMDLGTDAVSENDRTEATTVTKETTAVSTATSELISKVGADEMLSEAGIVEDRKEAARTEMAAGVSVKPVDTGPVEVLAPKASGITMTEVQKPSEDTISIPDTDPKAPSGGGSFEKMLPAEEPVVSKDDVEPNDDGPTPSPDTFTISTPEGETAKTEIEIVELKESLEVVRVPLRAELSRKEIEGIELYARSLRAISHPRGVHSIESGHRVKNGSSTIAIDEREPRAPSTRSVSRNGVTMRIAA